MYSPDNSINRRLGCWITLIAKVNDNNTIYENNNINISLEIFDVDDWIHLMIDDDKLIRITKRIITTDWILLNNFFKLLKLAEVLLLSVKAHYWLKHPLTKTQIEWNISRIDFIIMSSLNVSWSITFTAYWLKHDVHSQKDL